MKGKEFNLQQYATTFFFFFNPKGAKVVLIFYKWVEGILINSTVCPSVLNIVIVLAVNPFKFTSLSLLSLYSLPVKTLWRQQSNCPVVAWNGQRKIFLIMPKRKCTDVEKVWRNNLKIKSVFPFFFAVTWKTQWYFLSELDININGKYTVETANSDTFPSVQSEGVMFFCITHKKNHHSQLAVIAEKNQ